MSELVKFAMCGVIFCVVIAVVKSSQREIGMLLSIACSVVLLFGIFIFAKDVIMEIRNIFATANVDISPAKGVLKIICIAYIAEFSGSICDECGEKTVGEKVRIFGKITVLLQTMPLISNFITLIASLI